MKNSKNKIIAALVCGIIVGSIGTSFLGNFQTSENQSIASAENNQNPSNSSDAYENYVNRGNKHNRHQYDDSQDDTPTIDTTTTNYKDGTYTGSASGYAPNLTVEVSISSGKISKVDIISHNESPGFYEKAFDTVPNEIISSQSTDVDTVSGATYSSKGIINAVEDALQDASSESSSNI